MAATPPLWRLAEQELLEKLDSSPEGLSQSEAVARLARDGANELPEPRGRSLVLRFVDELTHFMALLLWAASALAFVARTPELGWAILAVIWINAGFSFWQEFRAERALAALLRVLPAQARVWRDGELQLRPARELVPGDVIELEEGDRVSADGRLLVADALLVDASLLTGESMPIERVARPLSLQASKRPVDLPNIVLAGTVVTGGRGKALVYATGVATELGKVAHLTSKVERAPSTLEVQVRRITRVITAIAIGVGSLVFVLGTLFANLHVKESFLFAIGIVVAFVPEGLLPTVTLALSMAVQRMARKKALIRRLSTVDTLGATTVICTDKTGTLTKNEMTVRALWIPETTLDVTGEGYEPTGAIRATSPEALDQARLLLGAAALCSNARWDGNPYQPGLGDPMEVALLVAAAKAGLGPAALRHSAPRIREIPFDAHRKRMTVVVRWGLRELWHTEQPFVVLSKGAATEVLSSSTAILRHGEVEPLGDEMRREIARAVDTLAERGHRILGVACQGGGADLFRRDPNTLEKGLIFVGLVALIDPPRPEVAGAIALCRRAGIRVTMVTGDYGLTATAIGRAIGLISDRARVISGEELDSLDDRALRELLAGPADLVFARAAPEHKLRLVEAYRALGEVVAVTGDGANDAPALRAAHVGIAMGVGGTDVAREASDMVLLDNNFATIVSAIEQGRAVYANLRKFMTYILASNMAEVVPFIAMVALRIPPALTIMQILAVDLGTDMIPALALGSEPPEAGVMEEPPRSLGRSLLDRSLILRGYGFLGAIEAVACMVGFLAVWRGHGFALGELRAVAGSLVEHTADPALLALYAQATSVALASIVACQDGNVFACRSERASVFRLGLLRNRLVLLGIAVEWAVIATVIYLPPAHRVFGTTSLAPAQLAWLLVWPPLLLGADELRKLYVRWSGRKPGSCP